MNELSRHMGYWYDVRSLDLYVIEVIIWNDRVGKVSFGKTLWSFGDCLPF